MSVLGDWIAEMPTIVLSLSASIAGIDTQIAELTLQKGALDSVLATLTSEMNLYLPTKGTGTVYVATSAGAGGYGTTNLTAWCVYKVINTTPTYLNPTTFTVPASAEGLFSPSMVLGLHHSGTTVVDCSVVTVTNMGATADIVVQGGLVYADIQKAMEPQYKYNGVGWDSDVYITSRITEFNFTYDHLSLLLGLTGTYGINDMITKLGQGKSLLTANKNKYNSAITVYARFA